MDTESECLRVLGIVSVFKNRILSRIKEQFPKLLEKLYKENRKITFLKYLLLVYDFPWNTEYTKMY